MTSGPAGTRHVLCSHFWRWLQRMRPDEWDHAMHDRILPADIFTTRAGHSRRVEIRLLETHVVVAIYSYSVLQRYQLYYFEDPAFPKNLKRFVADLQLDTDR